MVLTISQKNVVEQILTTLTTKASRGRRVLATVFLELVSQEDYPEYYDMIPNPRCLNQVRQNLQADAYTDALEIYSDIALVFWNALYYNEDSSQIAKDAQVLKDLLDNEWRRHNVLPSPRMSPPPSAPQKTNVAAHEPVAPIPSRSYAPPMQRSEPEIDIESGANGRVFRDKASEELVVRLDKSLPKWPGFGQHGWWEGHGSPVDIVHAIKSHKDLVGNRYAPVLEAIPAASTNPNLPFAAPLSLESIEARARQYVTLKDFDHDMSALFMKARRWYDIGSEFYGQVILLQRLYQALTSGERLSGPPYTSEHNFAGVPAGPGTALPDGSGPKGIIFHKVPTKDRIFVDTVHYKGWTVRIGDWLHLANPDDPCRPIVALVWKCWESTSADPAKSTHQGITVAWYFRPEQTFHASDRRFWENEVFRTTEFVDHPLPDIIEQVFVQPTTEHIRGRPRAPHWYPGFPLFMCDAKYTPSERSFQVIKNWATGLPEEIRKGKEREMDKLYEFERTIYVAQYESPLLGRGKGKGKDVGRFPGGLIPSGGASESAGRMQMSMPNPAAVRTSGATIATSLGNVATHAEKLSPDLTRHFDRHPETNELLWFAAPPLYMASPAKPRHSLEYLAFLAKKRKLEDEAQQGDGGKKTRA